MNLGWTQAIAINTEEKEKQKQWGRTQPGALCSLQLSQKLTHRSDRQDTEGLASGRLARDCVYFLELQREALFRGRPESVLTCRY